MCHLLHVNYIPIKILFKKLIVPSFNWALNNVLITLCFPSSSIPSNSYFKLFLLSLSLLSNTLHSPLFFLSFSSSPYLSFSFSLEIIPLILVSAFYNLFSTCGARINFIQEHLISSSPQNPLQAPLRKKKKKNPNFLIWITFLAPVYLYNLISSCLITTWIPIHTPG